MIALGRRTITALLAAICSLAMVFCVDSASAQLINVRTPFQTNGDSYYERTGINFGLNFGGNGRRIRGLSPSGQLLPRVQLTQGSSNGTIPGFGGYDPNGQLNTGFASVGGDVGFSFGFTAGKGNRRSSVTQSPSVTMFNGASASIFSGRNQPFVTRIDPVVGLGRGWGVGLRQGSGSALLRRPEAEEGQEERRRYSQAEPATYSNPSSSATVGDISIAEIQKQKVMGERLAALEIQEEIGKLISQAESLEADGEFAAARAKYSRALRKVARQSSLSELRESLQEKVDELRGKR